MPDDNRFAGLSDVVEEESETDGSERAGETENESSASTDTAADDETVEATYDDPELGPDDAEGDESDAEADDDDDATNPAAFSFDATTKKTVYVRQGTIDDLEDARALVDARLRTQHDVRDLTGREFYDAVFRLAADDTDGLVEEIRDERAD